MQNTILGISIPDQGVWKSQFGMSMSLMMGEIHNSPPVEGMKTLIFESTGTGVTRRRHELVKKNLQRGTTHLLFLDCDMNFPPQLFHKLYRRMEREGINFLGANCVTRVDTPRPTAYTPDRKVLESKGRKGVEEVDQVGLAVALIRTEELKKINPPLFMEEWIPEHNGYCGEDVYFCQRWLEETGNGIYVDHEVSQEIGHVGDWEYTHFDMRG